MFGEKHLETTIRTGTDDNLNILGEKQTVLYSALCRLILQREQTKDVFNMSISLKIENKALHIVYLSQFQ